MSDRLRPTDEYSVAIIGGGIIGLALARIYAMSRREVVLFEAEKGIGTHASSRNSGVVHAGIYYPNGSLKAEFCVQGNQLLSEYCLENNVPYQRIGKVIVATDQDQIQTLEALNVRARLNGVHDLEFLDEKGVYELEPNVKAVAGILSPSTGIVDPDAFMQRIKKDAESQGAIIQLNSPVMSGEIQKNGIALEVYEDRRVKTTILFDTVINAAGLYAQALAYSIRGLPQEIIPETYFAKGHYVYLKGKSPFNHLVYPVPEEGGLGAHATIDFGGKVRFGPDVVWVDKSIIGQENMYNFDENRIPPFYEAIRRYYPHLKDGDLDLGTVGIRPKLGPEGSGDHDFWIQGHADHGVPGYVHLAGIESPGVTAAFAIAQYVLSKA